MTTEIQETAQTPEEKFFGVKTSIDDMRPSKKKKDDEEDGKTQIEIEETQSAKEEIETKKPEEESEELEKYGDKVQKRIDKLTWQFNEEKRQREASEKLRDEAVNYAQKVNQQNQQQAQVIATGEANLVEQIKGRAAIAVESATAQYSKVYEEGDTAKIVEAQKILTLAQAEEIEAKRYDNDYQQRVQNWTAQQQQNARYQQQQAYLRSQQPQQPQQPKPPTQESQSWAAKNPWFGKNEHRDMTAIAYATHEKLIRDEGIKPDTDEYYTKIDTEIRTRFPEYFEAEQGQGTSHSASKPSTVVAAGTRNNGGKPRIVRLKPSQVALAKKLGITTEQYAAQVLKGER